MKALAFSFLLICAFTAAMTEADENGRQAVNDVLSRPYGQGAPRLTDYRDDWKPEYQRRRVDPPRLYEFFDGFTFSVGRTGKATYYYQGKKFFVQTDRTYIKSEGTEE